MLHTLAVLNSAAMSSDKAREAYLQILEYLLCRSIFPYWRLLLSLPHLRKHAVRSR